MTAGEIIAQVDELNPNDVTEARKLAWMLYLEKQLLDEVLMTHVLTDAEQQRADDIAALEEVDTDYVMLVQPPYSDLYRHYLDMQICLANVDNESYENAQTLYNNALLTYKNWFNRTHRAKVAGERWRF